MMVKTKWYHPSVQKNPIKAIVMTCDRYRPITDHMIACYQRIWPGHPFVFRIPYQNDSEVGVDAPVEFVKTAKPIRPTVLSLIDDLRDEDLVYWCIDDKYPVRLNVPAIEQSLEWLRSGEAYRISGILNCRSRRMWDRRCILPGSIRGGDGQEYLERTGYQQIWIHQFLRVKVLRHLFETFPEEVAAPRDLDAVKDAAEKPPDHHLLVSRRNHAVFGESADEGTLTRNCRDSMVEKGLPLPDWADVVTRRSHFVGKTSTNTKQRMRYLLGRLTGRDPDFYY